MNTIKPPDNQKSRKIRGILIYTLATCIFLFASTFLIWSLRDLILPCVLGVLLAYLFRPLIRSPAVSFLPYKFRVISSLVMLSLFFLGMFFIVQRSLPDERGELELRVRLLYKLNERYTKIMGLKEHGNEGNILYSMFGREIDPLKDSISRMLILDKQESEKFMAYSEASATPELTKRYLKYFSVNQAHGKSLRDPSSTSVVDTKSESTVVMALHLASIWFLMPIIFLFLLFDDRYIVRYFVGLVPNRYFELTLMLVHEVDLAIGNYLRGTFLESVLVSISFTFGLMIIGFPFKAALIIGVVAGAANAIPFLGPLIGLVIGLVYALIAEDLTPVIPGLTNDSIFFAVFAVVVLTHLLDNALFAPVVLGSAVNLHPLVVILGVMGGSIAFGFAGMLLAIPTIVVVKVTTETLFRGLKSYRII